jgi:hypothetical protein
MLAEWVRSPRFGRGDRRRPRDPDATVDGDAAVGTGKNRVEVELETSGRSTASRPGRGSFDSWCVAPTRYTVTRNCGSSIGERLNG